MLFVRVPELSRRLDEIAAWSNYMLERCSNGGPQKRHSQLHDSALPYLRSQTWPGNLRQLDNVIRRAYAYSLLQHSSTADSVVVSGSHVARAINDELGAEGDSGTETVLSRKMMEAARLFAEESLKRSQSDRPLPLTLADTFRSMVIDAALNACNQDKDAALEALGLGNVVRDRNHHRVLKRESELLQKFYSELATPQQRDDPGEEN